MQKKPPRNRFPSGTYSLIVGDNPTIGKGNWAVPYVLIPHGDYHEMKEVVKELVAAISVMPCYWREFVGEDLAVRVDRILE
jgi:hypothetical protein